MSDEADAITDAIKANAAGPASVSGDAGSVTQRPLSELIEADKYLAAKEAGKQPNRGLRLTKLVPPGAA